MTKTDIVKHILANIDGFIGKQTKVVVPTLFPVSVAGNELADSIEEDAHIIWWGLEWTAYLGYAPITDTNIQGIKQELSALLH